MDRVCVIMSTYNGEKYLSEQLDTILGQRNVEIKIFVRDDGSTDNTVNILKKYSELGQLEYIVGENLGAAKSFMSAIMLAPDSEYYAFSDQDDVWEENKIEEAVKKIQKSDSSEMPILYHSKVKITNERGEVIGENGRYEHKEFLNGYCGYAIGCTVVFNNALMNFLKKYNPQTLIMHDAWVKDVCIAVEGKVIFDNKAYICYRQHGNNVVGGGDDLCSKIKRRIKYYKKRPNKVNKYTLQELLIGYRGDMSPDKVSRAEKLCNYDKSIKDMFKVLVERSYFSGNFLWGVEQYLLILFHRY